jgi:6-phosphogluconate dehydrogenase
MKKSEIGIYGLGVMGQNLALNFESKGISISVFNRMDEGESHVTKDFLSNAAVKTSIKGTFTLEEFIHSLETPRRILIMVRAGNAVDEIIEQLLPHLTSADIIIDGGNSHYTHTNQRQEWLSKHGILFLGVGISGGEDGARNGPAIMPGGSSDAMAKIMPILNVIAAKAPDGTPCCEWVGEGGAGHFVKMVHNGIEYADMQLLAEVFHIMKSSMKMSYTKIAQILRNWNEGDLNSYLIEITADILEFLEDDGRPIIDKILDSANQKGTGKWTVESALELGVPLPVISAAVYSRNFSSFKPLRTSISGFWGGDEVLENRAEKLTINDLKNAFLASRMMVLAEGFFLIRKASEVYHWDINPVVVARNWRSGCIIRSSLLGPIAKEFTKNQSLQHLLLSNWFKETIPGLTPGWRNTFVSAGNSGIPTPCISAALHQFDMLSTLNLPANLIQAQRDYFGAHTYERIDAPRDHFFHTNWTKSTPNT